MSKVRTVYIRNGDMYRRENEGRTGERVIATTRVIRPTEPLSQQPNDEVPSIQDRLRRRPTTATSRDPPWLRRTTEIFLDECVKHKTALRHPRQLRRKIFSEVRLAMLQKGYNFDEQALDRKFRNLKTHFFFIKKNNNKKKANRIMWPYFEKMNEIFSSEKKRNTPALLSFRNKPQNSIQKLEASMPTSSREIDRPRKFHYAYKLERLRNELLAFEERRTIAIEAIAAELAESNRLNREKLNLLKLEQGFTWNDSNEFC